MTKVKRKQVAFDNQDMTPVGTIIYFSVNSAPNGYLIANGSAISRTNFNALWTVIGTTFGEGDGSTTFNLPNLVGASVQGVTLYPCIKY